MIQERKLSAFSGWIALIILILFFFCSATGLWVALARAGDRHGSAMAAVLAVASGLALGLDLFLFAGLFTNNPNEAKVLQLLGRYVGTVNGPGFWWANPLYKKTKVSLRLRNFETNRSKVNDKDGNPIEIASVVVWKVADTAEACFVVDNFQHFVEVQSEAALRNLATQHPYDSDDDKLLSLRGHTAEVAGQLKKEIQERLTRAGIEVMEARISYLAYAQEIAGAMLQRQQAGAIIAARQRIVDGAVGMVEMALHRLSSEKIIELDEERKAAMVSNLLVVLCGERGAQPVLNAGTIYH